MRPMRNALTDAEGIREQARAYGLDFYPTIFEMCDYEQMNQIAAYGGFRFGNLQLDKHRQL